VVCYPKSISSQNDPPDIVIILEIMPYLVDLIISADPSGLPSLSVSAYTFEPPLSSIRLKIAEKKGMIRTADCRKYRRIAEQVMDIQNLKDRFAELYGSQRGIRVFFAPGRVNLIGEHTDYNGGHVLPCALHFGTFLLARKRKNRKLRFYSLNFPDKGIVEWEPDSLKYRKEAGWTNYPAGVVWALQEKGFRIPEGLDVLVCGDIPAGAGLSSSASLEIVTALALREMFGFRELSLTDLALVGQYAENKFNGMNCGIMDQFAVAMGKRNKAIFLDTSTLDYQYVNVELENAKIVITNSKVKHSLVDSGYNTRRQESETALRELQKVADIQALGDLKEEEFEKLKSAVTDPVCRKRARHAVYENQRTIRAVEALNAGQMETFGKLMNESHISLRDDYEVSCSEVDGLVECAWAIPGVVGSRMTGGGFGGCTVSIVKSDALEQFCEMVPRWYWERTGLRAEIYVADIGSGAREL
jgi:galactokinase